MQERARVVVIGAGVAGLAAARALREHGGVDVVVYEAGSRAGGVVHTSRAGGFLQEHAANGVLGAPGGVADLARALGVDMAAAAPAARHRWIYRRGALRALPSSPVGLIRTDLLSWRGKLAALAEPLRPRQASAGDETVAAFVRRRLGAEVADAVVAPFVTGVFAGRAEELSVQAAFPLLAELERQGGLVRGMVRRQVGKAMERLRAGRGPGGAAGRAGAGRMRLSAPVGGLEALVRALAEDLGDALALDTPVAAVAPDGDQVRIALAGGEVVHARAAVLATPAPVSARLVGGASPALAAVLDQIPYVPAALVHLGFERERIAHALDGFGFLVAEGEDLRMLGTVFESVLWPDRAPAGQVLLRSIFGGARDPGVLALADDALVDTARRDLQRALGIDAAPVHTHVVRWPAAIPQYTLGHGERVARAEALARPMGLVLAGSAYRSVALNGLVADAGRVAGAVLARLQGALAVLVLGLLSLAGVACAGGSQGTGAEAGSPAAGEAGPATGTAAGRGMGDTAGPGPGPDRSPASGSESGPASGPDSGSVHVTVAWPDAPAAVRRSPGRNPCGAPARAPIRVHTLGGVDGAVVSLLGAPAGGDGAELAASGSRAEGDAARLGGQAPQGRDLAASGSRAEGDGASAEPLVISVHQCQAAPRVASLPPAGGTLAIVNQDERRHQVRIEGLGVGNQAPATGAPARDIPLPVAGSQVDVTVDGPGMLRIAGTVEPAYVVAPGHARVAVTDDVGLAQIDQVPAGSYELLAWHPPVREGGAPLETRAPVTVEPGRIARVSIVLAPPR